MVQSDRVPVYKSQSLSFFRAFQAKEPRRVRRVRASARRNPLASLGHFKSSGRTPSGYTGKVSQSLSFFRAFQESWDWEIEEKAPHCRNPLASLGHFKSLHGSCFQTTGHFRRNPLASLGHFKHKSYWESDCGSLSQSLSFFRAFQGVQFTSLCIKDFRVRIVRNYHGYSKNTEISMSSFSSAWL